MGDIEFDIDVRGARRVIDDIDDAIEDGMKYGAGQASEEAKQVAKQRIRNVGAIFSGDLVSSFDISYKRQGNTLTVRLENESDHAAPIEYGAEYTGRGPPVVALIPWVRARMSGFTIPEDERDSLPDPVEVDEDFEVPEPDGSYTDIRNVAEEGTIERAFWLQEHIKENGIDAVRYMERAEQWADENAADTVADAIEAQL